MIKEHLAEGKGAGGKSVSGAAPGSDSAGSKIMGGVSPTTSGGDPYSAYNPKSTPGHVAQLKHHAGEKVAKGGSSQAGSVGPYQGK